MIMRERYIYAALFKSFKIFVLNKKNSFWININNEHL